MSRVMRALLGVSCLVVWSMSYMPWPATTGDQTSLVVVKSNSGSTDVQAAQPDARGLALVEMDALALGVLGITDPTPQSFPRDLTSVGRPGFRSVGLAGSRAAFSVVPVTIAPVTETTTAPADAVMSATTVTVGVPTAGAPAGSVQLKPGDAVVSIVSKAATGTTFWFNAGTYNGLQIVPKANQVFLGASGAILDGNGKANAFRSGADNVEIRGLVIEDYDPADKEAAIQPGGGAENWLVVDNEIRYNSEVGVQVNGGWEVVGNFIHHNGRYGINGSGSGVLIEDNEISYNATDYGASGSSGGTKFNNTTDMVIRGNYAHHNYGNGLWVDIDNVDVLIEDNTVTANERNGIFIEISCGGTIRNNYVDGNGTVPKLPNWMGGSSGILVSLTPDVVVYDNTLVGNTKGIGMLNWAHANVGKVTNCKAELRNLSVHDNSITQNGGAAAGIEAPVQTENVLNNWGNEIYSNTYILSGGAKFRLRGAWVTLQAWNSEGFN